MQASFERALDLVRGFKSKPADNWHIQGLELHDGRTPYLAYWNSKAGNIEFIVCYEAGDLDRAVWRVRDLMSQESTTAVVGYIMGEDNQLVEVE